MKGQIVVLLIVIILITMTVYGAIQNIKETNEVEVKESIQLPENGAKVALTVIPSNESKEVEETGNK